MLLLNVLCDREDGENVAGNIELAMDEGFTERDLPVGTKQRSKHVWVVNVPGKTAELSGLGVPARSVPIFDGKIAWVVLLQQFAHNRRRL